MRDGRHTEAGEQDAQRRGKVVPLPRDWLGPRDELVPFGPRAASLEADLSLSGPHQSPPSPADFWGEQSADLQSALQRPVASEDRDGGAAGPQPIRVATIGRRAVVGAAAVLAIAAVTLIALVATSLGPSRAPRTAAESKLGFAAVLSGGIPSILRLDLKRIGEERLAGAEVRRTPHREPAPKPEQNKARPVHKQSVRTSPDVVSATAPATTASSTSYHPTSNDTSGARNAGGTHTHSSGPPAVGSSPSRPERPPQAPRATVSATGESGALGPIESPNG